ncbi:MAG TPA: hypothetical protein VFV10_15530 [Gammaproteobacteria bacterium]|nr:hypothetical protein [Gammaproteobacteria bacterium]
MTFRIAISSAAARAPLAAALVLAAALAAPARGQEGASATGDVLHGINGAWERYPTRFSGLGSEPVNGPPPPEAIPDPPLKPMYLEEWRAKEAEIKKLTDEGLPPANNYSACIPDGMPAMMQAMFPMEVLETPGQVTVIEEAFNQVRRIYLDQPLVAPEEAEPRFAGHSAGHWEGDTLVVETVGVKDRVRFRNVPHSMEMRIVERMRLVNNDFLENRVTVTDPEYLTAPWSWTWMYRRWPGYKIQEYICEDNRYYADPKQGNQRLRIE